MFSPEQWLVLNLTIRGCLVCGVFGAIYLAVPK